MKLTEEQMAKVEAWIHSTFPTLPACPVCGGRALGALDEIFVLPTLDPDPEGARTSICLVCSRCCHQMLFDARQMGVP